MKIEPLSDRAIGPLKKERKRETGKLKMEAKLAGRAGCAQNRNVRNKAGMSFGINKTAKKAQQKDGLFDGCSQALKQFTGKFGGCA